MNDVSTVFADVRPRLQPTVLVVPLSEQRIALLRGTRQASPSLIVEDPSGWHGAAIRLMNGARTVEDIACSLAADGHAVEHGDVAHFVDTLLTARVVADGGGFAIGGGAGGRV